MGDASQQDLPVLPGSMPFPSVCSRCGEHLSFEEEKVCVPGRPAAPWWPFGDQPTRVYHPRCAP